MLVHSVNSIARCAPNSAAIRLAVMGKTRRKPLEDWQADDAARLKKLWEKRDPKVSQAAFAVENKIGETQGVVWQYLNGVIPLNLGVALKFARGLKCNIADFSPRLARALASEHTLQQPLAGYKVSQAEAKALLETWEQLSQAQRETALAKLKAAAMSNRKVSAILGSELEHPTDKHVAKALRLDPSRLPATQKPKAPSKQLPLFGARPKRSS